MSYKRKRAASKPVGKRKRARRAYQAEPTPFGDVGSKVGEKIGGFFGVSKYGKIGGRLLGTGVGKLLFGSGDYNGNLEMVRVNSIVNPQETPQVISTLDEINNGDSVIIRRTEYLTDIISSATANTFDTQEFIINPGQSGTFPFLSQIAKNYEEYAIKGMLFHFKSLSGDSVASVQSGLGYIAMATQYDVLDQPFLNKATLENYSMSQSGKPSIDQIHAIECNPQSNVNSHLYVRPGPQPADSDIRMYDLAKTTVATSCPGTNVTLGELWVTYEVQLFKPKILSSGVAGDFVQISRSNTATASMTFGAIGLQMKGSLVPNTTASSSTVQLIGLDSGSKYLMTLSYNCSSNLLSPNAGVTVTDGTANAVFTSPTGTLNAVTNVGQTTTVSQNVVYERLITPNAAGVITLTNVPQAITAASTFSMDMIIVQLVGGYY